MPSSAGSATAAAAAVVSRCLHTAAEESGSAVWNSSLVSPRSPARRPPGSPARRRAMGPRRHSRPATLASHPSPAERAPPGRGCAALRPSTWARPPRRRRTPPPAARRASRRRRPSTAHVGHSRGGREETARPSGMLVLDGDGRSGWVGGPEISLSPFLQNRSNDCCRTKSFSMFSWLSTAPVSEGAWRGS